MPSIKWNDTFSVGERELDDHHRHIVNLLGKLETAMEAEHEIMDPVNEVLHEMTDYLEYHFTAEERYMGKIKYPDFRSHRVEHEAFLKETLGFLKKIRTGNQVEAHELRRFLQSWLLNHILTTDKKYGLFASKINAG